MIRKNFLLFCTMSIFAIISLGCGGGVNPGVADAPEEAPAELTEEELAGEMEYTKQK